MVQGFAGPRQASQPCTPPARPQQTSGGDVPDFTLPSPGQLRKKPRLPAEAPVISKLCKLADDSSVYGLRGNVEPVVQIQYEHEAYPGLFFNYKESLTEFCKAMKEANKNFPEAVKDLEYAYNMKFVMSPEQPVQELAPYVRACYVKSSCVIDFIDLLDTFCNWRKVNNVGGEFPNITIEVTNATGMVFDVEGKEYDCAVTCQVSEAKVQLGIF